MRLITLHGTHSLVIDNVYFTPISFHSHKPLPYLKFQLPCFVLTISITAIHEMSHNYLSCYWHIAKHKIKQYSLAMNTDYELNINNYHTHAFLRILLKHLYMYTTTIINYNTTQVTVTLPPVTMPRSPYSPATMTPVTVPLWLAQFAYTKQLRPQRKKDALCSSDGLERLPFAPTHPMPHR